MARSFSQEPRSDSHKIGERRYRVSYLPATTAMARTLLLAGILLAVTVLAARSFFPAFAQTAVNYDENDDAPVATFTATDPEGENIVWSLEGVDFRDADNDDIFAIDGGVLTFVNPPNFEVPIDDTVDDDSVNNGTNTYVVTVVARDGDDSEAKMTDETVTVTIINLDEPGNIELTTLQPKVEVGITAALKDPDGKSGEDLPIDGTGDDDILTEEASWQWYRSLTTEGPWTLSTGTGSTTATYMPNDDDVGHYLRATAKYIDGQSPDDTPVDEPDKIAHKVSANVVLRADYSNTPPMFPDQDPDTDETQNATTSRSIAENSAAGTAVGAPVVASDLGADNREETLIYTLTDRDQGSRDSDEFEIDRATGQIRLKAGQSLDFEEEGDADSGNTYEVTVVATDPSGAPGRINVTINVTGVDEDPEISQGDAVVEIRVDEGIQPNPAIPTISNTFEASDPETPAADLRWSLTSPRSGNNDYQKFDISTTTSGVGDNAVAQLTLSFKSAPDYEDTVDFGNNHAFDFNVKVTDGDGDSDTIPVKVTIDPVIEGHSLTLSNPRPEVGVPFRVIFDSFDDLKSGTSVRYKWATSTAADAAAVPGGTSSSYTPRAGVVGERLTVTVTYEDGHLNIGDVETEQESSTDVVLASGANTRPQFLDGSSQVLTTIDRDIDENSGTNQNLGQAITATDNLVSGDTARLVYSISGSDASFFSVGESSGQLSTAADFDYEDPSNRDHRYTVTLTAKDPSGATGSVRVNIDIGNLNEAPEIRGDDPRPFEEGGTGEVAKFTGWDPEGQTITWTIEGTDDDDTQGNDIFSISSSGSLRFVSPPDFEAALDSGNDNTYEITLRATVGTGAINQITRDITIRVENKDEAGEVKLDTLQPKQGISLTATLSDPDEGVANASWQWSHSSSRSGPWPDSTGTGSTTASYTPDKDDVGDYLRAVVVYTDGESDPVTATKTAHAISTNVVQREDYENTPPMFPDQDPDTEDVQNATTSRSIAENSSAGTAIGAPITAVDLDVNNAQENLTYSLSGDDAGSFDIDRGTGQIRVKSDLNYESANMYEVSVIATDPGGEATDGLNGNPAALDVTIMGTDVPEDPVITGGAEEVDEHPEDDSTPDNPEAYTYRNFEVATYTATDQDDNIDDARQRIALATLKWSLSGPDRDIFIIGDPDDTDQSDFGTEDVVGDSTVDASTAQLRFKEAPNFEEPKDSGRDNVYNVTVTVTDSDDMTASRSVVVTLMNVEEDGTVRVSNRRPQDGIPITATLTDPDGGITGLTWQWFTSDVLQTTVSSDTFTPSGEALRTLRVRAVYNDNSMSDRPDDANTTDVDESKYDTASYSSLLDIVAEDDMNALPEFADQDTQTPGDQKDQTRYVREDKEPGGPVVLKRGRAQRGRK